MALVSNRLGILDALVALMQTFQNPSTSQNLYQLLKAGAVFDPGPTTTWGEVMHFQGKGGPAGSGGAEIGWRIDDSITYLVTSAVGPYETDSTAAERNMAALQDIVLPTLRQHFQFPQADSPLQAVQSMYSMLVEQPDRSRIMKFPNGHSYKLWDIFVTAKQQYNVELIQP